MIKEAKWHDDFSYELSYDDGNFWLDLDIIKKIIDMGAHIVFSIDVDAPGHVGKVYSKDKALLEKIGNELLMPYMTLQDMKRSIV